MVAVTEKNAMDALLKLHPFAWQGQAGRDMYLEAVNESYGHHFRSCSAYRKFCERRGFGADARFDRPEDLPFLSVQVFKEYSDLLRSVAADEVRMTLSSSATNGRPSIVAVDKITSKRQIKALAAVMGAALGGRRRPFLVFDANPRVVGAAALGARNAAVRGFLNLACEVRYVMDLNPDGRLLPNKEVLERELEGLANYSEPVCVFGFTFVLYVYGAKPLMDSGARFALPAGSKVVHIGGWKKLKDQQVSKEVFNETMANLFSIDPGSVVDFYGFTEQMGVTYPDGRSGLKCVPVFSDVIVRNPVNHEVLPAGQEGLLEFVTPLPYSYPGLAVLTDDVGVVHESSGETDEDGWTCKRFEVLGRVKEAGPRGCGDVMSDKIAPASRRHRAATDSGKVSDARLLFDLDGNYCPENLDGPIILGKLPRVEDLRALAARVRERRTVLDQYSIDELILLVDRTAQRWMSPDSRLFPLRTQGLQFLSSWCRAGSMRRVADLSFRGIRGVMDGPQSFESTNRRLVFARPRGLVAHWLAGNVPLLGMLALVQGILTRNANLLKTANSFSSVLPSLLDMFRDLEVKAPSGRTLRGNDVLGALAVVYFPREDLASATAFSEVADVRVAWGGRESIESVMQLPRSLWAEDIFFGPKLSYMAIGREYLDGGRKQKRTLRRAATDASVFDQYACASPHTIFVERGGAVSAKEFAERLSEEMQKALVRIPKAPADSATEAQIESVRLRYELTGDYWRSEGSDWTVLYDGESVSGLADPVYSRVVSVRAVDDILSTASYASSGVQTIGLAVEGERRLQYVREAALRGAERFPDVGRMTFFDSPWDGLFPMDRLVKWITVGGPC
ncbi:MAG: Long-chain acyl-protein thioester reductase [Verrucomicrobia subdivision 3 bacterium]|nr:Long-chain acyl-protein thioester reductase [Limisphaerales bacterium]MCS1415821.1 Long-chain acyl-protein thioester reductase [Limisphaerales bacterium]